MSNPETRSAAEWQADLDRSDEEIADGQIVSMTPGRARLRQSIAELEAKLGLDQAPVAAIEH